MKKFYKKISFKLYFDFKSNPPNAEKFLDSNRIDHTWNNLTEKIISAKSLSSFLALTRLQTVDLIPCLVVLHTSSSPTIKLSRQQIKLNDQPRSSCQVLTPRIKSHHSYPSYWITRRMFSCCSSNRGFAVTRLQENILNIL